MLTVNDYLVYLKYRDFVNRVLESKSIIGWVGPERDELYGAHLNISITQAPHLKLIG